MAYGGPIHQCDPYQWKLGIPRNPLVNARKNAGIFLEILGKKILGTFGKGIIHFFQVALGKLYFQY